MLKIGLGYQALFAVVLGVLAGLFFGPLCSIFEPVGTAFVMLLQMVVLPYIPTLLMHGLGSLSPETAKKLFTRGWFFLLLLWGLILGIIFALSALIPAPLPDPAADYSEEPIHFVKNFLSYIIPQNPFYDLANNIVPAVAFFSLILGVAIMHLKQKEPLLGLLEKSNSALEKVFKWIAMISPIGIFAHIANAMGTVNFEDLYKLELYVVVFILTSIYISLWVLPTIVSCLTGIPYRELIQEYRIVCILAFATGIPSIAFPFINNCMRRLAEKKNLDLATFRSTSQTVVPLAYSFTQIGNFFLLFFIFFISFFYRHPLSNYEWMSASLFTIPLSFGTPQLSLVGMSFLIDALQFPHDAFNLFVETMAITLNFQVLMSVSAMLTFIILVLLRYYGLLEVNWRRLSLQASTMIVVLLGAIVIGNQTIVIEDNYRDLYLKLRVDEAINQPPKVTVYQERISSPPSPIHQTLARVLKTGVLRVGYDINNIPYCYLNQWGEVVGYDIAYAYQLAKDLDANLELIPLDYDTLKTDLDSGYLDILMSAILVDEERALSFDFSHTYSEQANVLVIPAYNVDKYRNLQTVMNDHNLLLGVAGGYKLVAERHLPNAKLVDIHSIKEIFNHQVDAILWSELPAFIWCLSNPEFTALSYQKQLGFKYFAYGVRQNSLDFVSFVNQWMMIKEANGFHQLQTDYWIHGKRLPSKEPRWSIIRNVLHWVK